MFYDTTQYQHRFMRLSWHYWDMREYQPVTLQISELKSTGSEGRRTSIDMMSGGFRHARRVEATARTGRKG